MPKIKAKPLRLIDVLYAINPDEIVKITYNHGRNTCSWPVRQLEVEFSKDLGKEIIGLTSGGGTITIFI